MEILKELAHLFFTQYLWRYTVAALYMAVLVYLLLTYWKQPPPEDKYYLDVPASFL